MVKKSSELLALISFLQIMSLATAGLFENLCVHPFQFGTGKQKGLNCTVKYKKFTTKKNHARELCDTLSPFDVLDYKNGFPTVCTYVKSLKCDDHELPIDDLCITVMVQSSYSENACGEDYQLHTIQSRLEHKWITVLMQPKYFDLWIGNEAHEMQFKKPILPKRLRKTNKKKLKIKLRVDTGTMEFIPRGTTLYAKISEVLFHVCARKAEVFEHKIEEDHELVEKIGIPTGFANDSTERARPFFHMPIMVPVRGTKMDASVQELQKACEVLPNGYVASLRDFRDPGEFAALRAEFPSGLYRTTIAFLPNASYAKKPTCKGNKRFKGMRIKYMYYGPDNSSQTPHEHWKDKYPSWKCADLPRTTVAMETHYMDIPAMARRNLICSYGTPPNLPPVKLEEQCNKLAHWDSDKGSCVCNDPSADGRLKYPEKFKDYPEGAVCFDCENAVITRSIVFILDGSGTVTPEGWRRQKEFMMKVIKYIKNVRVGLVVISARSYPEILIDHFENVKFRFENFLMTREYPWTWTAIGPALYEARWMLSKETTTQKIIVMISDGDEDQCKSRPPICGDEEHRRIRLHPQRQEADLVWAAGIKLIYIVCTDRYKTDRDFASRVAHIARGIENAIPVEHYTKLDKSIFDNVLEEICKEAMAGL
ncbi:unnamed protein product [Cylicocyclus nassatus]|uniref:VWFA domain-containing protein n=1 Tax=Cylicocyclus nassatus TaxID=53992 RepID=A0AA36M0Y7_CYLNA|nr:unnamed protein product [Cylicocyclus nassatus]